MSSNNDATASSPETLPTRTEQVTVAGDNVSTPKDDYKLKIYKLGITEVVLGVVCCMLWAASIVLVVITPHTCYDYASICYYQHFSLTYISAGLWCGIFPIISGALGVRLKKKHGLCMLNANMTMSIISSVMMGVLIVISFIAATGYGSYYYPYIRTLHILLSIFGLAGMITSIVHSAFCCAVACCHGHEGVTYTAPAYQCVQLPDGQLVLVPTQSVSPQNCPVTINLPGSLQPTTASILPSATGDSPAESVPVTTASRQPTVTVPHVAVTVEPSPKLGEAPEDSILPSATEDSPAGSMPVNTASSQPTGTVPHVEVSVEPDPELAEAPEESMLAPGTGSSPTESTPVTSTACQPPSTVPPVAVTVEPGPDLAAAPKESMMPLETEGCPTESMPGTSTGSQIAGTATPDHAAPASTIPTETGISSSESRPVTSSAGQPMESDPPSVQIAEESEEEGGPQSHSSRIPTIQHSAKQNLGL